MRIQRVCILGGSGFVGRHLANRLHRDGIHTRIPTRRRERARHLLVIPGVELVEVDVHDPSGLKDLFRGMDAVINLVGILNERGKDGSGFRHAHVELTEKILAACRETGVKHYLHMSALGADAERGPSFYQKTKGEAEGLVRAAHGDALAVTIFRPSVIFGHGDSFFNRFAGLLRTAPGVFPLPTPNARFAPVYVGDVCEAFARSLGNRDTWGETYDLCGPREYTLKELVDYTAQLAGLRRIVWPAPDWLSRLQASLLQLWPTKPYSRDNYLSATVDNTSTDNGLPKLGIHPTAVEAVVPAYIGGRHVRGLYNRFRKTARR